MDCVTLLISSRGVLSSSYKSRSSSERSCFCLRSACGLGILYKINPSPVVALNMAIISSQVEHIDASIKQLLRLEKNGLLDNYYLLFATLGHFYAEKLEYQNALTYLRRAIELTSSSTEVRFLKAKINICVEALED